MNRTVRAAAATMLAGGLVLAGASTASAANTKTCDTGHGNFTQTQTNACGSNGDVNQGPVTNQGGNAPKGQNQ